MISAELVDRLNKACRGVPRDVWNRLSTQLAELHSSPDAASIQRATAGLRNRDAAWILSDTFLKAGTATWAEIAAAMVAVGCMAGDGRPATEIIWTGPTNDRYPVRRIDQVLYDLIATAQKRIVLITFAAHRIPHLCEHLARAVERSLELTLIVESEGESEGQLTSDAIRAFRGVPASRMRLYYWPLAQRERNQAGRPGKLHAKCAVVDDVALVGSANLTDDAFNRNMELGLLVKEPLVVSTLIKHFDELIRRGVLTRVDSAPTPPSI
jgi:phosphatidylserine/phosphatidylglycerophosphate/cardiolipin synthase-like enzyme